MSHPKNKYERVKATRREKAKIKRLSSYGYNPYVGWAVVPKDAAAKEKAFENGVYCPPRAHFHPENRDKAYYIQQVDGGMAKLRKTHKTKANRNFRRADSENYSAKGAHKRHYDVKWNIF